MWGTARTPRGGPTAQSALTAGAAPSPRRSRVPVARPRPAGQSRAPPGRDTAHTHRAHSVVFSPRPGRGSPQGL